MTLVARSFDCLVFIKSNLSGRKGGALSQAASESWLRQHQTGNNDALSDTLTDASAGEQRDADAVRADTFYLANTFDKRVGDAGRIDQFGRYLAFQNHSPSGGSSVAFGRGEVFQKRSVHSVNASSARGRPSLAGTDCDSVSETEAQLVRPRAEVLAHILSSTEPRPRVRADVNGLRRRDVAHRRLPVRTGASPWLQSGLAPLRGPREPVESNGEQAEPVTALRRSVGDSMRHAKTGECA